MTISLCVFIFVGRFIYFKDPSQDIFTFKGGGVSCLKKKKDEAVTEGFPPAAMSMTPGYFNGSQKGNKTKRTSYM